RTYRAGGPGDRVGGAKAPVCALPPPHGGRQEQVRDDDRRGARAGRLPLGHRQGGAGVPGAALRRVHPLPTAASAQRTSLPWTKRGPAREASPCAQASVPSRLAFYPSEQETIIRVLGAAHGRP